MLSIKNKQIIYDHKSCQQCGVCQAICPQDAISTELLANGLHNVIIDSAKCVQCQRCVKVCPANKPSEENDYCESFRSKEYFLGYHMDNEIRRKSSSGGVCRTLIIEGLRHGLIDGAYAMSRCKDYPYAKGMFYTKNNLPAYDEISNSLYHTVMIGENLDKVQRCNRLMIVGTSCQLWAMEGMLKGKCKELIKVCIFCKQQKTLESTRFLAKIMGSAPIDCKHPFSVRYRGMGWPGIVQVKGAELPYSRAAQLPFGRRLWTVPGCDICSDPFGVSSGADVSLMDPWNIRTENDKGETLVTVHTHKGHSLIRQIPHLVLESKTYEEVLPALDLIDVWRKQQYAIYCKGESCTAQTRWAGRAERLQRFYLRKIVEWSPSLPILFYRCVAHIPDLRNLILKHKL